MDERPASFNAGNRPGDFLGLSLGIPYSSSGNFGRAFEIVSTLGPIIAAIPSIIIGFGISPFIGFAAAFLGLLVHQLENYLLVPKIMEKSVDFSYYYASCSGNWSQACGIAGVFISMPVLITSQVLLKEYLSSKD